MDRDADLSPTGLAALIAELLQRLELTDVTLVGNDTGGALCQMVLANHPERIARLVLTNCDAFEDFPPPAFKLMMKGLGRIPGAVAGLATLGRLKAGRRAAFALAPLTVEPLPDELVESWVKPLRSRGIRRDLIKVLRGISPEHTLAAAKRLPEFQGPRTPRVGKPRSVLPTGRRRAAGRVVRRRQARADRHRARVRADRRAGPAR